ncbi:MAG: response regulator [Chthoniobacterales bacterium]
MRQKGRILVVENIPIHQKVTTALLVRLGYECDLVTNGHDALTALMSTSYSVIFMDIDIPKMDGYETTRVIREFEKTQTAPWKNPIHIVALTGCATQGERENGIATGMNSYLTRPVSFAKLQAELDKVVPPIVAS